MSLRRPIEQPKLQQMQSHFNPSPAPAPAPQQDEVVVYLRLDVITEKRFKTPTPCRRNTPRPACFDTFKTEV
jgi:hypothetical protein